MKNVRIWRVFYFIHNAKNCFLEMQWILHCQILHSHIMLCTGILQSISDLHLRRSEPGLILLQQDKSSPACPSLSYHFHFHTFPSLSYLCDSDGKDGAYHNMYRSPFQELLLIPIRSQITYFHLKIFLQISEHGVRHILLDFEQFCDKSFRHDNL